MELLQNRIIWNYDFPWYLSNKIEYGGDRVEVSDGFAGTHLFFYMGSPVSVNEINISNMCSIVQPILDVLKPKSLLRIKANFYPQTASLVEHDQHWDFPFTHKGAIFCLNTCDGFTRFDDQSVVSSIENRLIIFDTSKLHNSTTCTDERGRFNIAFNYF